MHYTCVCIHVSNIEIDIFSKKRKLHTWLWHTDLPTHIVCENSIQRNVCTCRIKPYLLTKLECFGTKKKHIFISCRLVKYFSPNLKFFSGAEGKIMSALRESL